MNNGIIGRLKYQQTLLYLKRLKASNRDCVNYIVTHQLSLDDPDIMRYVIDAAVNGTLSSYNISMLIDNGITYEQFSVNEVLYNRFLDFFVEYLNEYLKSGFSSYEFRVGTYFKILLETNQEFKNRLAEKLNFEEIKTAVLSQMVSNPYMNNATQSGLEILKTFNHELDENELFDLIVKCESYIRYHLLDSLSKMDMVPETLVDRLYEYKFEMLKEWCKSSESRVPEFEIPRYLNPSKDNEMAHYWMRMDKEMGGKDSLAFVISRIREYSKTHDAFSERSVEDIFTEWKENMGRYYDKPRKAFFDHFDENTGRLFNRHGLPKDFLFSNDHEVRLLRKILTYNYEGHRDSYLDYELIDFLIANIDRLPKEYRFIFEKLKELQFNQEAQIAFLSIMTDSHFMFEDNKLFDENGFTERFYDVLINSGIKPSVIDIIDPTWRSHYDENIISYMENYQELFGASRLYFYYDTEKNQYQKANPKVGWDVIDQKFPWLTARAKVERYFTDGKPNNTLLSVLLTNVHERKIFINHEELIDILEPTLKAYVLFLKGINFNEQIVLDIYEIKQFFDENGPHLEFCKFLYDKLEFDALLITNLPYKDILSPKETLVIDEYKNIDDVALKGVYRNFVGENLEDITEEKIRLISQVLKRISNSNSTEMIELRTPLAVQILATENPLVNLDKIEELFLKNNIPTVGKIFSVFEILHPDFSGFSMDEHSMISPTLKRRSNTTKKITIFADLMRAALGSNNRSLRTYIKNLREGNAIYEELKANPNKELTDSEIAILNEFISHLQTMYSRTLPGRKVTPVTLTGDYLKDLDNIKLQLSPNGTLDYSIVDRVVEMFCTFVGIKTLDQLEQYMDQRVAETDRKNREKSKIDLKQGDFVKGIGGVQFLGHILQNGSVSKEYLGAYSRSDATPLDTDLSMILGTGSTPEELMKPTAAATYGPIWIALKNDDRFAFTRRSAADPDQRITTKPELTKFETFYTGVCGEGHYGIRTGFSSSDIDYIIVDKYDKRIGLEIAMNGFYIPVFDKKGTRVFSPWEYDMLREKMSGLSHYNAGEYQFSEDLAAPGVAEIAEQLPLSREDILLKRKAINKALESALSEHGIALKHRFDGDLSEGTAELIDTGSTGRFTNMPGDGDFDFMLKLDKKIIQDPTRLQAIKQSLLRVLGKENATGEVIGSGDFRLKKVTLPDLPMTVDIDITFEPKTDKVEYSTDESLKERLENIRKQDPQKYLLVVSNILLAKKLLKHFEVYKPNRGEVPQGGLGGVGIENWILQNGGSLKQAAESFLRAAEDQTFEEFKQNYVIWDFGTNHLITRRDIYPHDNFVYNMSPEGFERMKKVLREYVKSSGLLKGENIGEFADFSPNMLK